MCIHGYKGAWPWAEVQPMLTTVVLENRRPIGLEGGDYSVALKWPGNWEINLSKNDCLLYVQRFLFKRDVYNHCLYFLLFSSQALVSCLNIWIQAWILSSSLELSALLMWWWFSRSALSDFYDPGDCNPPGSSVHGISQVKTLEWSAVSFLRRSSRPRDWTCISCIVGCLLHCGDILYWLSHQGSWH